MYKSPSLNEISGFMLPRRYSKHTVGTSPCSFRLVLRRSVGYWGAPPLFAFA
jgi:hypothetical protein